MSGSERTKREEINNSQTMGGGSQFNSPLQRATAVNYPEGDSATTMGFVVEGFGTPSHARSDGIWDTTESLAVEQDISFIASLMVSLIQKVDNMTERISSVEDTLLSIKNILFEEESGDENESPVQVTKGDAKEMVLALFHEKGRLGYTEIMTKLHLDLELIVDICAELEAEGKIEGIN